MSRATLWVGGLAGVGLLATLGLALLSPVPAYPIGGEVVPCEACRIFYFHVPSAWLAYLAFFVVFVGSIAYLRTGARRWDILARSSAEVGVIMTTITLLTGSFWGRPIWGIWWSWDARMTTTLILWFVYVAYLMLRAYLSDDRKAARFSAVLGIVGFAGVPINHLSVTLWRTLHPEPIVIRADGPAMPEYMIQILALSLVSFTLFYVFLVRERMRMQHLRDEVKELEIETAVGAEPRAAVS